MCARRSTVTSCAPSRTEPLGKIYGSLRKRKAGEERYTFEDGKHVVRTLSLSQTEIGSDDALGDAHEFIDGSRSILDDLTVSAHFKRSAPADGATARSMSSSTSAWTDRSFSRARSLAQRVFPRRPCG